nr:MAG TPA: hypothetical protein [Caudoviricetes sp.]
MGTVPANFEDWFRLVPICSFYSLCTVNVERYPAGPAGIVESLKIQRV